jgi:hypothetical protein
VFPSEVDSALIDIRSKATCLEVTKVMAQQLEMLANVIFQYQWTGDESLIAFDCTPSQKWTIAWSEVDLIAWLVSHPPKAMMTVFFSVNGIALIDILPEKAKLNFKYFRKNIIKELDPIVHLSERKPHANHMRLHFDNALFASRE